MLTLIIALLLNAGIISSAADYENATPAQQEQYNQQYEEIVGTDIENI